MRAPPQLKNVVPQLLQLKKPLLPLVKTAPQTPMQQAKTLLQPPNPPQHPTKSPLQPSQLSPQMPTRANDVLRLTKGTRVHASITRQYSAKPKSQSNFSTLNYKLAPPPKALTSPEPCQPVLSTTVINADVRNDISQWYQAYRFA